MKCLRLRGCLACLLLASVPVACDRRSPDPTAKALKARPSTVAAAVETAPATRASRPLDAETRPATNPATAPAADTQPASLPAGDPVPAFVPLTDAQVGEWAMFDALHGRRLGYKIVKAGATTVHIEVSVTDQGKPLGQTATREEMRDLDPLVSLARPRRAQRSARPEPVQAGNSRWEDAMLYEDRWQDEGIRYLRKTWVSAKAPVFGTLRMELYGDDTLEARMELTAFGK